MKQNRHNNWWRLARSKRLWVCVVIALLGAFIAYKRYPTYLTAPNFYAEDGTVFAKNVMEKGFLEALLTPFNGYFIVGIYLLEIVAFILNALFGHGNLLNLPTALAVTSYGFWGLLCALPLLLFWRDIKNKIWMLLLGIGLAMLPLPGYNYAILGTVGNYKFAFLFIAVLLIIKRMRLQPGNRLIHLLDAGLVVCTLTNATVYLLLPFVLIPYWPGRKHLFQSTTWKHTLRTPTFISLAAVFALVSLQVVYVAVRGGVDDLQGYLQEPYQAGKTIEIFLQRTLLFPFDHSIAKHLNDGLVVLLTGILVFVLVRFARREDRIVAVFGLYAALAATALFVSQRTGVSQFYDNYQTSGPDHFFYTQNFIIFFTVVYVLARSVQGRKLRYRVLLLGTLCLLLIGSFIHNDFSKNAHMNRLTGDFRSAVQQACQTDKTGAVSVPVYPVSAQLLDIRRDPYCSQAANYTPRREPLTTTPFNNNYLPVNAATVTQTFTASHNALSGISVFISTFGGAGKSTYALTIYDKTCKHRLRTATFVAKDAIDNAYHDIRFEPLPGTKGQTYCFALKPVTVQPSKPPIAIQFSAPDIYPQGTAAKDGTLLREDIVFDLLYK